MGPEYRYPTVKKSGWHSNWKLMAAGVVVVDDDDDDSFFDDNNILS